MNIPVHENNYQMIGRISGPFGIKGEVKVILSDINPDILVGNKIKCIVDKTKQILTPVKYRVIAGGLAFRFLEIPDRNVAETYPKSSLSISINDIPETQYDDEGEFLEDFIGFSIKIEHDDHIIGTFDNIYNFGAGDILELKYPDDKTVMIPVIDDMIIDIDTEKQVIILSSNAKSYLSI